MSHDTAATALAFLLATPWARAIEYRIFLKANLTELCDSFIRRIKASFGPCRLRSSFAIAPGRQSFFLLAVVGLLILCAAIGEFPWVHEDPTWRIAFFFLLLPAGLAVTFTWPRNGKLGVQAAGLLLLALVVRLALLPHPADS